MVAGVLLGLTALFLHSFKSVRTLEGGRKC